MSFNTLAEKLWILLVIYSQLVLILLCVWQIEWTIPLENSATELIGTLYSLLIIDRPKTLQSRIVAGNHLEYCHHAI